jgi:hypothetical protein
MPAISVGLSSALILFVWRVTVRGTERLTSEPGFFYDSSRILTEDYGPKVLRTIRRGQVQRF